MRSFIVIKGLCQFFRNLKRVRCERVKKLVCVGNPRTCAQHTRTHTHNTRTTHVQHTHNTQTHAHTHKHARARAHAHTHKHPNSHQNTRELLGPNKHFPPSILSKLGLEPGRRPIPLRKACKWDGASRTGRDTMPAENAITPEFATESRFLPHNFRTREQNIGAAAMM